MVPVGREIRSTEVLRLSPLPHRRVGPRRLTANPYEERGIVERKAEMLISRWVSPGYLRTAKSSIFARVVVSVCLRYIDHQRTGTSTCEPSLRRCLNTFASIACATTRGPGACRNDASTRRANPFRSYSYLPNDISARERLFCGDGLPTDRGSYNIFHDFTEFQHGHRARRGIARLRNGGGGLKGTRR